jgi:hypothetical protein
VKENAVAELLGRRRRGQPSRATSTNLEGVLDTLIEICKAHEGAKVSVANVVAAVGHRSFGPLLVIPGLIGISPIGAIPFVPALMAVVELLIAGQILLGRKHFWIPGMVGRRSIAAARLRRALGAMRRYAKFFDKFLGRRLTILTHGIFLYALTVLIFLVALVMPIIEIVPLAGIVPNAAIVAFGLAITAHDGVWVLIALLFTAASIYLLASAL